MLFSVPPGAFQPPPKVDSAVIRVTPRTELPTIDQRRFVRFVSACFQHKRKTLRNNLAGWARRDDTGAIPGMERRAEQLTGEQFLELFSHFSLDSETVEPQTD